MAEVLTERGCYVLLVPDRNLCFDCNKPLSTLGQILKPYVYGRQNASLASMIDEMRYGAKPEGGGLGGWRYAPSRTVVPKYENRYRQIPISSRGQNSGLLHGSGINGVFRRARSSSIMSDLNKLSLVGFTSRQSGLPASWTSS